MQRSMARPKAKLKQNLTNVKQRKTRRGPESLSVFPEKRYIRYMRYIPGQSVFAAEGSRYIRYRFLELLADSVACVADEARE